MNEKDNKEITTAYNEPVICPKCKGSHIDTVPPVGKTFVCNCRDCKNIFYLTLRVETKFSHTTSGN